ncbi:hypothetical protein LEP1GSC188_4444 [Leptospira weilii serovar Topaz str. LT2116]|uniref:Uncharacterized protein n=1 Tax=Leptospira weilii serovar Topaz str. LT2116 TaxID=1088540 RepID=M3H572_9LEPT|nr:hypothetical protein LEP1GSC188_4444 [Leptospira weilii serovar Topaz str. LT2116]
MQVKNLEISFNKKGGQKPPLKSVKMIKTRIAESVALS